MKCRSLLAAAALVPLALGDTSYSYDYTDAPTAAPTSSMAPTRTETYAPTRMTEAPSYAPTTDTYAPTMAPTATEAPTPNATMAPTPNATLAPAPAPVPPPTLVTTTNTRRNLLEKVRGPVTQAFHNWQQRHFAKAE
jgi:hypothetical protein